MARIVVMCSNTCKRCWELIFFLSPLPKFVAYAAHVQKYNVAYTINVVQHVFKALPLLSFHMNKRLGPISSMVI